LPRKKKRKDSPQVLVLDNNTYQCQVSERTRYTIFSRSGEYTLQMQKLSGNDWVDFEDTFIVSGMCNLWKFLQSELKPID